MLVTAQARLDQAPQLAVYPGPRDRRHRAGVHPARRGAARGPRPRGAEPMSLLEVDDLRVVFSRTRGSRHHGRRRRLVLRRRRARSSAWSGSPAAGSRSPRWPSWGCCPSARRRSPGAVRFDGTRPAERCPRGSSRGGAARDLAMVFQDPMTSLNPVLTLGRQLTEVLRTHTDLDRGRGAEGGRGAAGPGRDPRPAATRWGSTPTSSPAGCASASSSPSRWPAPRASSSPTSPRPPSTSRSRRRCWTC